MLRRLSFGLIAAVLLGAPLWAEPSATEAGRFVWQDERDHFGGFSALELDPDGIGFVTVSDRGWILQGQFQRNTDGQISGVDAGEITQLAPPEGQQWSRWDSDSEGLAIAPDGTAYVSFEGMHRVFRYDDLLGPAIPLPAHADFDDLISNSSLEALAIGPDGGLYTMPERSGRLVRPFPIYRLRNGEWTRAYKLPRQDNFLPVGVDFGPDGKFYLLDRRFQLIRGFANRVRRFTVTPNGLVDEELLFESQAGRYYDLEGLAVWRGSDGLIRLTMVSDDNFNFLQSTEIVEYVISE